MTTPSLPNHSCDGRRLTAEEIAATPLAPGFTLRCHSRRPDKPNEILLHLECPRGHQIIKPRTTALGGCDTCRREDLRRSPLPDDWKARLASLSDGSGLPGVARALGISYEAMQTQRRVNAEFKTATDRLVHVRAGKTRQAPGPRGATLNITLANLERSVADLQSTNLQLRAENKSLRERIQGVPESVLERRVRELMKENADLHRRVQVAESVVADTLTDSQYKERMRRAHQAALSGFVARHSDADDEDDVAQVSG